MTTLREACVRLVSYFRQDALDRELDEELASHIELATQDHLRLGMSLPEARRLALAKLGGIEPSKQRHREWRGLPRLDEVVQDMRHAVRGLRRSPGFTLIAIATVAIGVGVNAAVFTITNAVLFKGFRSVDRNDRILYLDTTERGRGCCVSYPDFADWRAQATSFKGMGAVAGIVITLSDSRGLPERYDATRITANAFALLGHTPIVGRDFSSADATPGAPPVAILTHGLWERRFGKDPAIVGETIRIEGVPTTVIGVMAPGFTFPQNQALWLPLVPVPEIQKREARGLWFAFGRLADEITIESARAEMDAIGSRLASAYPLTNQVSRLRVQRFHEFFVGPNATLIYGSMWGAVGFVLLIACANLANLMLARAIGRSREMSLRLALGAGRWRIVRQLLVESLMLSVVGGLCGWWLARWSVRAYALAANPPGWSWFENLLDYSMDYRVFAYLVAISIGTALLFGLAPALKLSKLDVNTTLKDGGRGASGGRGTHLSAVLVIAEMALAIVLLAGAGVMIRSFLNIYTADIGVSTRDVLTALLRLPDDKYPDRPAQTSFFDRVTARLATIPGVQSVAVASSLPTSARRVPYERAGMPVEEQRRPTVPLLIISPPYFQTLGLQLLSGRAFTDADGGSGALVAIVNERFASTEWPGEDPIGKRVRVFDAKPEAWLTVVGVAPNIMQGDATRQTFDPVLYLPYREKPGSTMWVLARAAVPAGSLGTAFRREVQAVDAELSIWLGPIPLSERLAGSYWNNGFYGALFLLFAAIALLLAAAGLYAVIAHAVGQRTQEIGIRMAIGGTGLDIVRLVFRQAMFPSAIGLTIGLAASFAINRLLTVALVQVSPADPITYVVASAVLIAAASLGCLIPARRAMRVDPVIALRQE